MESIIKELWHGNIKQNGESLSATSTNLMLTVLNLAFEYGFSELKIVLLVRISDCFNISANLFVVIFHCNSPSILS